MEWYRIKKAPLVLGHEIAGDVVAVGEGVTEFQPGDRVTATHHVPCGRCEYCQRGQHTLCSLIGNTKYYPGGFAEYVRVPAINVETKGSSSSAPRAPTAPARSSPPTSTTSASRWPKSRGPRWPSTPPVRTWCSGCSRRRTARGWTTSSPPPPRRCSSTRPCRHQGGVRHLPLLEKAGQAALHLRRRPARPGRSAGADPRRSGAGGSGARGVRTPR